MNCWLPCHPGKQLLIDHVIMIVSRNDICGYHGILLDNELQVHLYSNNIERKVGSHDLTYGQV